MTHPRPAFTLVEVMAVVLILGVLATATVFSLAEQMHAPQRADVLQRLAHEDALARLATRRTGRPASLRMDLEDQRLWRVDDPTSAGQISHSWKLPPGYRIDQILRPAAASGETTTAARTSGGVADILFNVRGCSQTYALRLICPPADGRSNVYEDSVWLVFAGLTGQQMVFTNESEVENLLAALGAPRPDAR